MSTDPAAEAMMGAPRPRADIATVILDGEIVLYDERSRTLHHLNAAASLVWQQCDGRQSIEGIARSIAAASNADVESVSRDVTKLVAELTDASLLVRGGGNET